MGIWTGFTACNVKSIKLNQSVVGKNGLEFGVCGLGSKAL